ncbi:MAG: ABC transporter permease subunit [Nocardioides sp.]|uniref:ABC transporter permease subunit n=1 Tax=Nocardioides sp. TaxID=35761 RepID=UPI003D6ACB65
MGALVAIARQTTSPWLAPLRLLATGYTDLVFRAGILAIHPIQVASAEALALTRAQTMRFVVLPQAVRRVVTPLMNDLVPLQTTSSV